MYIRTEEQISELLTKMVERNASDEDLAGVIRYSATYISGRNSLDKTCQEYGLYKYLTTCVPSLSEVSRKIAELIAKKDCALDAEHMILFGNQLLKFYKDLEEYSIDLYFNEVLYQDRNPQARSEADENYQIVSGRSKLYELLEEIDKGDTV